MSNISRHQAGTQIAGQKTGGQFKAAERTQARSIPTGAPQRDAWLTDLRRLDSELQPHIIDAGNGVKVLSPDTPKPLAELHQKLMQIGYANGWLD